MDGWRVQRCESLFFNLGDISCIYTSHTLTSLWQWVIWPTNLDIWWYQIQKESHSIPSKGLQSTIWHSEERKHNDGCIFFPVKVFKGRLFHKEIATETLMLSEGARGPSSLLESRWMDGWIKQFIHLFHVNSINPLQIISILVAPHVQVIRLEYEWEKPSDILWRNNTIKVKNVWRVHNLIAHCVCGVR